MNYYFIIKCDTSEPEELPTESFIFTFHNAIKGLSGKQIPFSSA